MIQAVLADDRAALLEMLGGVDVDGPVTDDGWSLLHLAAQEGATGAIAVLLEHGASVTAENAHGNQPVLD